MDHVKTYKRKFDAELRHVKVILLDYQKTMTQQQWTHLLEQIRICILKHPDHFICCELPDKNTTKQAINLVFDGFLKDMHVRQVQAFRKHPNYH